MVRIFLHDLARTRRLTLQGPVPNFVSNIFYLTVAMSHYGYLRTIQTYNDFGKHIEDMQRHVEMLNGDGSWMGVSPSLSSLQVPVPHIFSDSIPGSC